MELLGCLFSNVEILSQYMHGLLRSLTDAEERGELENSIGLSFLFQISPGQKKTPSEPVLFFRETSFLQMQKIFWGLIQFTV